jgi:hypothetical protein
MCETTMNSSPWLFPFRFPKLQTMKKNDPIKISIFYFVPIEGGEKSPSAYA